MKNEAKRQSIKPSFLSMIVIVTIVKIYTLFKMKITHDRKALRQAKKRGKIIIYNHYSNKDHYITGSAIGYKRMNYVLSSYYYFNPKLVGFLSYIKGIRKDQFKPDLISIRKMKKVVDNNGIIVLAPTGQVSIHGNITFISPSIVKLLRLCKADVIALQIRGSHLAFPKWRRSERKCKIATKFVPVLTKEEIEQLSDDEIYQKVINSIDIREYEDQVKMKRIIKGEGLMEGLENVFAICPKCLAKYQHQVTKHEMVCLSCGNHVKMDKYGFINPLRDSDISFKTEFEWYEFQKNEFAKELARDDFCLKTKVELYSNIYTKTTLNYEGRGIITYNKKELFYEGRIGDQIIRKDFNLEQLIQLPFSPGEHFEVPDLDASFKFVPTSDLPVVIQWVQIIDILREQRQKG